jgi:hypothetical protein
MSAPVVVTVSFGADDLPVMGPIPPVDVARCAEGRLPAGGLNRSRGRGGFENASPLRRRMMEDMGMRKLSPTRRSSSTRFTSDSWPPTWVARRLPRRWRICATTSSIW